MLAQPTAAPAWRFAWTNGQSAKLRLQQLMSRRGWIIAGLILLGIVAVAVTMRWPIFSSDGPVWVIYRFHDDIIVPLKGRIWDRYAPWSGIAAIMILLVVGGLLVMRGAATRALGRVAEHVLAIRPAADWLIRWADSKGAGGPGRGQLQKAAQRRYQNVFATAWRANGSDRGLTASAAQHEADLLLRLLGKDAATGDVAALCVLCQTAAQIVLLFCHADLPAPDLDLPNSDAPKDPFRKDGATLSDLELAQHFWAEIVRICGHFEGSACEAEDSGEFGAMAFRELLTAMSPAASSGNPVFRSTELWAAGRWLAALIATWANDRRPFLLWQQAERRDGFARDLHQIDVNRRDIRSARARSNTADNGPKATDSPGDPAIWAFLGSGQEPKPEGETSATEVDYLYRSAEFGISAVAAWAARSDTGGV